MLCHFIGQVNITVAITSKLPFSFSTLVYMCLLVQMQKIKMFSTFLSAMLVFPFIIRGLTRLIKIGWNSQFLRFGLRTVMACVKVGY
jgi:hypothetical protein